MKIFLSEEGCKAGLSPLSKTKHVAHLRVGILTLLEKWQRSTNNEISLAAARGAVQIPANILVSPENRDLILQEASMPSPDFSPFEQLRFPWDIFRLNDGALRQDYKCLTAGRETGRLSPTNKTSTLENIFIEEGAVVEHCILNAEIGPIYIGKNALLMEGCTVRGPFAICENAVLKMGSKVYGATTIGPHCIAGGEIKNSILSAYSNKAHDGYLGDSVIGEWCNLGAGTSNSNLKNTAGTVRYYQKNGIAGTGAGNKGGLIMGDYSRCAINTSFNTAAVVGVGCNIFGDVSTLKYIDDFSWGTERYGLEKLLEDISNWKRLKGHALAEREADTLKNLYYTK